MELLFKKKSFQSLLAVTLALPLSTMLIGVQKTYAEGPNDPAPYINAKVVNSNAGKKVLFDNTHGETAGAADWVIDGGFSDFGNALANDGFYVKELRKTTPITLADLQGYDVFVIGEANIPYKASEQQALLDYVKGGGSIFFIADHYNSDRNMNRWDSGEVFNGFRRGAWTNPTQGMSADEANSAAMQGVTSSDWLADNFGVRFRFNALGDINATGVVSPDQSFGITQGVGAVAMHAGSTLAILDPTKAKGIVYLPQTDVAWASAVDQGVYNGGGVAEGPFSAIAKVGLGKAAFIGDSSPIEDATPKYLREDTAKPKTTYDGFKEVDDATYFVNLVDWLGKKESYTSLSDVPGLQLDQPTKLYDWEQPANTTEPQPEPWANPTAGYKWYDQSTFKPGSYGGPNAVASKPVYTPGHQSPLPSTGDFQVRLSVDNLAPGQTLSNLSAGIYLAGGTQVGEFQNADGSWPTNYGYSAQFSVTADSKGHASKDLTVHVKPGTLGSANLRFRQNSTALITEAVTFDNVPVQQLPPDQPPVPATTSIASVRSLPEGSLATVEGVVTTEPGAFGGEGFYLQDSTGGIYVYQNATGYHVGDKIKITGSTDIYNSELELGSPVAITKTGTADVPAPVTVTAMNDQNQGQRINLQNVTVENIINATPSGSFEFDAVNGSVSNHVRIDVRTGVSKSAFPFHAGEKINVSGVSSIFKGTYQLKSTSLSDFTSADTTAPVTTINTDGVLGTNLWNNKDVTVTLAATDDNSGVDHTEYALNNGDWTTYTAPFTVSNEGQNTLQFRSVDLNGNVEAAQTASLNLDKTAPTLTLTEPGSAVHNVMADGQVSFDLTATDALSGVQSQTLSLDGQAITPGTVLNALDLGLGVHTVDATAVDNAGNVSDVSYTFLVDTDVNTIGHLLNSLVASGDVKNQGIATSLQAKLNTVAKFLAKGDQTQASAHLQDLKDTLTNYASVGNVTQHTADELNANIDYLLANGVK